MVVNVCLFPLPLPLPCGVRHQIIYLHIALPDVLFLQALVVILVTLLVHFLLVGVLVVHSIVKVLVIQFFIVPVQFPHSGVESDHHILIFQKALRLLHYFLGGLVSCLGVERAQDHTPRRVILQQAIIVSLNAARGELGVQIIRFP